jgi:hypothetical protein
VDRVVCLRRWLWPAGHQFIALTPPALSSVRTAFASPSLSFNFEGWNAFTGCLTSRYDHLPAITLSTEDATQMSSCPAGSATLAIDKGLTDALLCSAQARTAVRCMLRCVHAALRDGGCLIIISKAAPALILELTTPPPAPEEGGGVRSELKTPGQYSADAASAMGEDHPHSILWHVVSQQVGGAGGECPTGEGSAVFQPPLQQQPSV